MKKNTAKALRQEGVKPELWDLRQLPENERNAFIVTAHKISDRWVVQSRYGDDQWKFKGGPNNKNNYRKQVNFLRVPPPFREVIKGVMFRYKQRGREGKVRPKGATLCSFFESILPFLRYLDSLEIGYFSEIPQIVFANYVADYKEGNTGLGTRLSQGTLLMRLQAVEALYELSQYTNDPILKHPWPDASPLSLAGLTGSGSRHRQGSLTPLIPDDIFCDLFVTAYKKVQQGKYLLDLRDSVANIGKEREGTRHYFVSDAKKHYLTTVGWVGGLASLSRNLNDLRTACYIVLASTSGCRNHELANLRLGSHRRTKDDDGTVFHWMRSKSEKTNAEERDWMIPSAAVEALRLMERWAAPYQAIIAAEIAERRRIDPADLEIINANEHRHALFLGVSIKKGKEVRTLSLAAFNINLKKFCRQAGLNWSLASHQFRRKFANYAAHSQFGDLRYLREHFAHWSMDMTLGYAMDPGWGSHHDLELLDDINQEYQDIKLGAVTGWFSEDSLGGGLGRSLKQWQRDPSNLAIFNDHETMIVSIAGSISIRSNGHAWCTADHGGCIGNTVERTRCGGCSNGVIGQNHIGLYRELYANLKQLLLCEDIGEGGRVRVLRDIKRCREIFTQLGYDPEDQAA
ncbi:tyrosine-type recombinase/integrase [Pseudomonas syringae group sp. J309-1]|uniref:tyrosine-type recombinase/integrase n=1 Tax=Pseudomonas syringae group sp. J309-1 TaxID=3079588 RepID=UPI00290745DE|nr:tyrosine-type recombinase/integrase [Pseudomonas syringae group sp. J309-1]MDU8361085.1 tyrosine-type recombinase/integrase [Pseudomonas syringae group sp. J309-1]